MSISSTTSHELNTQGTQLAWWDIKMGKGLVVFTFSPRAPRIPGRPWWTHRKNTFAMSHYILSGFRLSTGCSRFRILDIAKLQGRTRLKEGLVYNVRNTSCASEEQLLFKKKRFVLMLLPVCLPPGEFHLLKSTTLKEILRASWVKGKRGNKTWYFTVDPLSPSEPARPSSP